MSILDLGAMVFNMGPKHVHSFVDETFVCFGNFFIYDFQSFV